MRPRELKTASPLIEAYGAQEIGVSLGRTVEEILKTPELGGRIAQEAKIAGAQSSGFTDEQREQFRTNEAERRREIRTLEQELLRNPAPIERETIEFQLSDLYAQTEIERNAIISESIEAGRLMSEEEFREQYGDLLEYNGLISKEAAQAMYDGRKEEIIRESIIQAGPSGIVPGVVKFGANIVNIATDPAELASMFIPIVGPARKAQLVSRFGRTGGRVAEGAIEGGVGSLLTEPLYYGLSRSQQLDYSMEDALFNVGAGFLLGGGIGTVSGLYARRRVTADMPATISEIERQIDNGEVITIRPDDDDAFMQVANAVNERAAARRARETVSALQAQKAADTAIRQFINDQNVDVSLVAPRSMPRPQSLSEFIRGRGGINDADPTFRGELQSLGITGRSQYLNQRGTQVNGLSNPDATRNLDDMAELAHEAGFIPSRDTNELLEALRQEQSGEFVFSSRDAQMAQDWRDYYDARSDYDREVARRNDIRDEMERLGVDRVNEDEVAILSEIMARTGYDLDKAAEQLSKDVQGYRAKALARNAQNDPLADPDASARADAADVDYDYDRAFERDMEIVRQMEEDGVLTDFDRAVLDEIEEIDARTDAYIENMRAGIACIVRN